MLLITGFIIAAKIPMCFENKGSQLKKNTNLWVMGSNFHFSCMWNCKFKWSLQPMANISHSVWLFTLWNILLDVQYSHLFFRPVLSTWWVNCTVLLPSSFTPVFSKFIQIFSFPQLKFPHDLETWITTNSVTLWSKLTQHNSCFSNVLLLLVYYLLLDYWVGFLS